MFFSVFLMNRDKCYSTSPRRYSALERYARVELPRACRLTVYRTAYRQLDVFVRSVEIFSTNRLRDALCKINNKSPAGRTGDRGILFSTLYLWARSQASGYQTVADCDKKSLARLGPILLLLLYHLFRGCTLIDQGVHCIAW